jgi:hypothetical protein
MLLPGCQCCGTCDACTRTCTDPHTGSAFEPVYTRFFEGVEVGNPADGYLSASGDSDTSDPYNGMDGSGPWFQQVGGGFSDGGSYGGGTRFPCTYRFSFWRSSYTLGTATIPPASTALTENVITVTVSTGAVVFPDGRVFTAADGPVALSSVPLVSGGVLAADPKTNDGTVSFALQCQNTETTFSVQARIRWATQKRQHVLYGIVRECYEDESTCATFCSGSPSPTSLYLTISNPVVTSGTFSGTFPIGTYVLDRVPHNCNSYVARATGDCSLGAGYWTDYQAVNGTSLNSGVVSFDIATLSSGICGSIHFDEIDSRLLSPCGTGVIASGSASWSWLAAVLAGQSPAYGTLDWKVER